MYRAPPAAAGKAWRRGQPDLRRRASRNCLTPAEKMTVARLTGLTAAIHDFRHPFMSGSVETSSTELLDLDNV